MILTDDAQTTLSAVKLDPAFVGAVKDTVAVSMKSVSVVWKFVLVAWKAALVSQKSVSVDNKTSADTE